MNTWFIRPLGVCFEELIDMSDLEYLDLLDILVTFDGNGSSIPNVKLDGVKKS